MTTKTNNLSAGLSGVTGEYYVAAELSNHGYLVSLTSHNTKGVDILCSNSDLTKSVNIQVKTNQNSQGWIIKKDSMPTNNLFYVFVNLNRNKKLSPDYHIVPSKIAIDTAMADYHNFMKRAKKNRNDLEPRGKTQAKFFDREGKYKDQWDLLGL